MIKFALLRDNKMTYLIVFNGRHGVVKERISASNWIEFIEQLNRSVSLYGEVPDLIYLEGLK